MPVPAHRLRVEMVAAAQADWAARAPLSACSGRDSRRQVGRPTRLTDIPSRHLLRLGLLPHGRVLHGACRKRIELVSCTLQVDCILGKVQASVSLLNRTHGCCQSKQNA